MTFESAVEWVSSNTGAIINDADKYLQFSPYDREDLISCANQAAITAVFTAKESAGLKFEQAFWNHYRLLVREIIPCPENHRWSSSVPSHLYEDIFEVEEKEELPSCVTQPSGCQVDFLSESIFWASYDHLSSVERQLLYKLLGLGKAGYHTLEEAGSKLGVSKASASLMFKKLKHKIAQLHSLGMVSLDDLPPEFVMRNLENSLESHISAAT